MTWPVADTAIPWSRRPARLGEAVVASLIDRIVSRTLPPGSSLPAEPVLCQDYSVSRSVIRESLKLLEEKGPCRSKARARHHDLADRTLELA